MKKGFVAFGLNFLLPGAGFAYLGRWAAAAVNVAVVAGAVLLVLALTPEHATGAALRWVGFGIAGASATLALLAAEAMNKRAAEGA